MNIVKEVEELVASVDRLQDSKQACIDDCLKVLGECIDAESYGNPINGTDAVKMVIDEIKSRV